MTKIVKSGKRKTAIARAVLTEGEGRILINKTPYTNLQRFNRLKIEEPIRIAKNILGELKFDAEVFVAGGGEKSQIEAARLALARGIVEFTESKELEKAYQNYDWSLLVADVRRKEAYKPGDSKARAKRQTSYR